ncbi:neutral/alkaline non-lysosomal ceramidase N-terminal domain-containing protein [Marinoscillum sp.]|uniref:neutral/alkaline non-lysosomal ceramidase N-terminal domain-containing protein n=1 Tax=Marinoscillum sp. TaxID=2024838 RepID=UPI003BAD43D8
MIRMTLKLFAILLVLVGSLAITTLTVVDRNHYQNRAFYQEMNLRLDSLARAFELQPNADSLQIGWSRVNITPAQKVPLAGYGARDPKEMTGIHDSSYVRTVIFRKGEEKIAVVTADLLIIHPELSKAVLSGLPAGWSPEQIYFTASHTHSGQGGWAPGLVGGLFAGDFDAARIGFLALKMIESIQKAGDSLRPGEISVGELSVDDLVKNRLAKEKGIEDPWMKVIQLRKGAEKGVLVFYSAHATCFGQDFSLLSGDFPARFNLLMETDSAITFSAYGASAVGSMGPEVVGTDQGQNAEKIAQELRQQVTLFSLLGAGYREVPALSSFRLSVPLPDPAFKISKHLALRPYLFKWAFGDYPHYVSVMIVGETIFVGMPCDFSGELAVPLYEKARTLGYQLIITSFNGDYAGYVIRDEWYDLPKYEARTMSWYGPYAGQYFTEIINRIIDTIDENYQTDTPDR